MSHAELNKHLSLNFIYHFYVVLKLKKSLSAYFIVFLILVVDISEIANIITVWYEYSAEKPSYTYNGNVTHGNWFLQYSVKKTAKRSKGYYDSIAGYS
jgi:hypothetical protein